VTLRRLQVPHQAFGLQVSPLARDVRLWRIQAPLLAGPGDRLGALAVLGRPLPPLTASGPRTWHWQITTLLSRLGAVGAASATLRGRRISRESNPKEERRASALVALSVGQRRVRHPGCVDRPVRVRVPV
jgi:hypothetical protein